MRELFTKHSPLLVGGLVLILIAMRVVLQAVKPTSRASRFILWFWHPEARQLAWRAMAANAAGERAEQSTQLHHLYHQTLGNMNGTLGALALVFFVIRPLVVQAFYIPSASMEPTLLGNYERQDRVLVNKYIYRLRPPKRQEIIVFHAPQSAMQMPGPRQDFIKRLIGVPGDTVEVHGNRVFINGAPIDEPYLDGDRLDPMGAGADYGPVTVPPGKYVVMGDNRSNSYDSRLWNIDGVPSPFVDADQVLGKAICVFWPPRGIRLLRTPGNN
ncbi:MAG: signal peptidase I [Armatimonadetes bacterium]|nr:signal peptidase I [Armatimonadota bacterium]